jgi:Cation/multidrug efflux pump
MQPYLRQCRQQITFPPDIDDIFSIRTGMLPMVIASGPGSASRHSIGTGVFFGMIVAITLGIILVPFFFVMVYKVKDKFKIPRT